MGGAIEIKSKVGKGTQVRFSYLSQVTKTKEVQKSKQEKPQRNYGKTILLVEDNPINAKIAKRTLEKMGVTIHHAINGQEGIALAGEVEHDLILMDIQMPVMDGVTATRHLIDRGHSIPIVAMTANVMEKDIQIYRDVGMVHHIGKPFQIHDLVQTLDHHLLDASKNS
jgi:CheY-like chemotaxis protein